MSNRCSGNSLLKFVDYDYSIECFHWINNWIEFEPVGSMIHDLYGYGSYKQWMKCKELHSLFLDICVSNTRIMHWTQDRYRWTNTWPSLHITRSNLHASNLLSYISNDEPLRRRINHSRRFKEKEKHLNSE